MKPHISALLSVLLFSLPPLTTPQSPSPLSPQSHSPLWPPTFCHGKSLTIALLKPAAQASKHITPINSPWDGPLHAEFAAWGYNERPGYRDELCDFGAGMHGVERAFGELGIGTWGVGVGDGGSGERGGDGDGKRDEKEGLGGNICFHVEHRDGRAVERGVSGELPDVERQFYVVGGRRYKVTQAYTTLAINPTAGTLFFLNRLSPASAAAQTWNLPTSHQHQPPTIRPEWLPALRATSDHAWGFWVRTKSEKLGDIRKIFSCMITNSVTLALIDEALRTFPLRAGEVRPRGVEKWPGTTWPIWWDAGVVMLGSPNGQAAGYFLAQHKRQLGGNKYIEKVTVFRPDKGIMPYLLFWVEDVPEGGAYGWVGDNDGDDDGRRGEGDGVEARIVKRSEDGRNVEREYFLRG